MGQAKINARNGKPPAGWYGRKVEVVVSRNNYAQLGEAAAMVSTPANPVTIASVINKAIDYYLDQLARDIQVVERKNRALLEQKQAETAALAEALIPPPEEPTIEEIEVAHASEAEAEALAEPVVEPSPSNLHVAAQLNPVGEVHD